MTNSNDPDRDRVLATAADLEQFIINSWTTHWNAKFASNDAIRSQMQVAAFENFAEIANFGMNIRAAMPRSFIDNGRGNSVENGNFRDMQVQSRAARSAALGIAQLDQPGFTIGSAGADARARAFAYMVIGASVGAMSLVYDSVAVISPDDDPEQAPVLSSYQDANTAALGFLDQAVDLATATPAAFPMPANFLNTAAAVSQDEFIRLVRTLRAQLRAASARTPADRAALDWTAIIADAENGITADFELQMNPSLGWSNAWFIQHFVPGGWHRMHQFMVGFADTTGAFDAWLATPRGSRQPFLIETPDQRFPVGNDRTLQQSGVAVLPDGQYFRNRPPGDDVLGEPLANSYYDHYRFRAFYNASRIGPFPVITKAEVDLLAAEGYIRASNFGAAETLINPYRTAAGLPAIAGTTSLSDVVPGGAGCVPRVPQGPSFTSTACGNILEALKWEKRMETAFTGWGNWYFDSRGWGDLPEGTAIHWPVPYQEMDARRQGFYNLGGCSGSASAGANTYGLSCSL